MDVHDEEDFTTKIKMEKNTLTIAPDSTHHGFWVMSLDRGSLPEAYRGKYTKKGFALKAAEQYIEGRKKD
jgi:hypothetical protein